MDDRWEFWRFAARASLVGIMAGIVALVPRWTGNVDVPHDDMVTTDAVCVAMGQAYVDFAYWTGIIEAILDADADALPRGESYGVVPISAAHDSMGVRWQRLCDVGPPDDYIFLSS